MPPRKKTAPKRMPPRKKNALMRIPAPPAKPWTLTTDEVTLVRNHIAKGATDQELEFCLAVARRYKLDPFRQQIWFVKRADRSAEGGYRWIPIVGINGLQHVAARDHKDYGSVDEPEYGPLVSVAWKYYDKSGTIRAPEWARVRVWKKGAQHPTVATVYWEEIYPDVGAAPLVRQMPRLMLGKCARAQAIRQAYPATDGLYIREEFQGREEFTPGGRQIVYPESQANHVGELGEQTEGIERLRSAGLWCDEHQCTRSERHVAQCESSRRALQAQAHAYKSGTPKAQEAENTLRRVEEADQSLQWKKENEIKEEQRLREAKPVTQKPQPAQAQPVLEAERSEKGDYIIRGDVQASEAIYELVQRHCVFLDGWWKCADDQDLKAIGQKQEELGFVLKRASVPQAQGATPARSSKAGDGGSEPELIAGVIEQISEKMTKGSERRPSVPYLSVLFKNEENKKATWLSVFDHDMFPPLQAAKAKQLRCQLYVKQAGNYANVVGLKMVGKTEFIDGKIPVVQQKEREAGKTLFGQ
jgi:hypothetical protein